MQADRPEPTLDQATGDPADIGGRSQAADLAPHHREALQAALPDGVVDSHHHVWDLADGHYPWLQDEFDPDAFFLGPYAKLRRNYAPADLRADTAPLLVAASVHIEAERDRADQLGETRYLAALNRRTGLPSAIMAGLPNHDPATLRAVFAGNARRFYRI